MGSVKDALFGRVWRLIRPGLQCGTRGGTGPIPGPILIFRDYVSPVIRKCIRREASRGIL